MSDALSFGAPVPPATPVFDAAAALEQVYPGVRPNSQFRGPTDPLSVRNPHSNHINSFDTIDVSPIEGVTYDQFLQSFRDKGYKIGEARDEASNPIPGLTTGPNWHVQILEGPDGAPVAVPVAGADEEALSFGQPQPPMTPTELPGVYQEEQPSFRGIAETERTGGEGVGYGERLFEDTYRPLQLNSAQTAHYDDFVANTLATGGTITPEMLRERWAGVAGLAGEDGEGRPGTLHNAEQLAAWMNENRQLIPASSGRMLQQAIAEKPTGADMDVFAEEEDDSWLTRQAKAISRSVVQSAQYAAPGWLGANLAYYQGKGFEDLKKLYPEASDEELNDLYWETINGLQGMLRDSHDERLQDDAMAPWLFGQLLAGLGDPLNLVPLGKAATTLKELGGQVVAGGALNMAGDAFWQGADIARGVEDEYSIEQTLAAGGIGAGAVGVLGGLQFGRPRAPDGTEVDIDIAGPAAAQAPEGPLPGLGGTPPREPFTPQAPDNTPPGLLREDLRASTTMRDPAFLAQRGTADPVLRPEAPEVVPAAPTRQPTTPGAYTVDEVIQHVDTLTSDWKYKPDFEIVNSLEEVADQSQVAHMIDGDSPDRPTIGFVGDDGKVRMIAGRITSPALLKRVLFHESLGHFGLTARYWKKLDEILGGALKTNATFRNAARDWLDRNGDTYANLPEDQQLLRAAEELLAEDSESGPINSTLRARLRHHVRNFLRRFKNDLAYDDADLDAILGEAHRAVRTGKNVNPDAAQVITYFRPMKAYQGGAARHSEFRDDYLGSGEGAHVYGYGHYFAENPETGRYYRQTISRQHPERGADGPLGVRSRTQEEVPLSQLLQEEFPSMHPEVVQRMSAASKDKDRVRAIYKTLDDLLTWASREQEAGRMDFIERRDIGRQAQEARRFLMDRAVPSKGYLYEVELPDDTGTNYIDLDMKWKDAPREVQQAIETSGIRVSDMPDVVQEDTLHQIINTYGREQIAEDLTQAYQAATGDGFASVSGPVAIRQAERVISQRLSDRGFVGYKYLDQGSRGKNKGSRNRVVFRDKDIKINERFEGRDETPIGPSDTPVVRPMQERAMNPTREAREEIGRRTNLDGMSAVNRIRQERGGAPETPAEKAIRQASTLTSESSLADLAAAYDDLDQYRVGHGHRAEAQAEALQARLQHYMLNPATPTFIPPPAPGALAVRPMRVGPTAINDPASSMNFRKAKAMLEHGRSSEDIFNATGWWKDSDGGWRRFLSDARAQVSRHGLAYVKGLRGGTSKNLSSVLDHPALYRAYPELADMTVTIDPDYRMRGGYNRSAHTIMINPTRDDPLGTLLHEIQHAIQQREGWSPGGTMRTHSTLDPADQAESMRIADLKPVSDPAAVTYLRLLGEIEARATARTRNLSRQELNAAGPTAGWDAPESAALRIPREAGEDSWDYRPEDVEDAARANVSAAVLREVADDPTLAPALEHYWQSMVNGRFPDVQQNAVLMPGIRRYIPETSTMSASDVLREFFSIAAAREASGRDMSLDEAITKIGEAAQHLDRLAWTPTARPMIGEDGPRGRGRVQGGSRREGFKGKAYGKYWSPKEIEGVLNENAPTYRKEEWGDWVDAANSIRRLSHGKIEERLRAVPEYAATLLAARHWLVGSANRIKDMSRMVDSPEWTPELDAQLQMEIARNVSMQEALAGAAGNGARAVNSFKIMVGSRAGFQSALTRAMSGEPLAPNMLSEEGRKELARIIRDTPDVDTVQKYTKGALDPRKADYLTSLWYAEVLSRPSTLFNNVVGTAESLIGETATDVIQAGIGSLQRASGAPATDVTTWKEAAARLWGKQVGLRQAFTGLNALRAFQRGHPISGRNTEAETLPWSALFDRKFSEADTSASKAIWKSLGLASRGVEFAPRTMAAIDEIFRSMAITSELYGRAAAQAVSENLRGPEFNARVEELVKNPTPEDIKAAIDKAQQVTYRDAPSPAGKAIEGLLGRSAKDSEMQRAGKALLRTGLAPFIITPDSILRTAIRHTPGLGFMDRYNQADWKSGPKGKARVAARMAFGMGILGVYESLYQSGMLHTALEDDFRARGSVEIGALPGATPETSNDLLSLNNLGPFTLLGMMYATLRDGYDRGTMDGKDFSTNMAEMAFLAASQALTNTWTEQPVGLVGAAEAVRGGEGGSEVNNYWAGQAAAILTPGVLASFNQAFVDPTYRSTGGDTTGDAVRNRVISGWPGYSQDLPAQTDSQGNEMQRAGAESFPAAMAQFLLGNRIMRRPDDPASLALQEQARDTRSDPVGRPSYTIQMDGEEYKLDRAERAQYDRTSSAYINDDVTALLESGEWQTMTPDERKAELSKIKQGAREDARYDEFWNNPDWRGN